MKISVNPTTFTEFSAFDDLDARVRHIYKKVDYSGTVVGGATALVVTFQVEGMEKPFERTYSVGKEFIPSEDGRYLIPVGKSTALRGSCNAAHYFAALANAGVPEEMLDKAGEDITALDGLEGHWNEVVIKRGGDMKDSNLLVMTELAALPGENEKAPTDFTALAAEIISELVGDGGKKKADLTPLVFSHAKLAGNIEAQKAVTILAYDDAFLKEHFTVKAGVIKNK